MSIRRSFALGVLFVFSLILLGCIQPIDQSITQVSKITSSPSPTLSASLTPTVKPTITRRPTKTPRPTRTPRPTYTPTLTLTPTVTLTSTPVPALVAHTWQTDAVLLLHDVRGGDGFSYPYPPQLVLYADGRLFKLDYVKVDDGYLSQILTQQLDQQQVCQILNSIDQYGFFDYDPSTYVYDLYGGEPTVLLRVNAWRSNEVSLLGLNSIMRPNGISEYTEARNGLPAPIILPAIAKTYDFILNQIGDNLQPYEPERLGVWVESRFVSRHPRKPWPLIAPKLADLYDQFSDIQNKDGFGSVLRGEDAKSVYELLDESIAKDEFTDGVYQYGVFARPLLPYEAPPSLFGIRSEIPAPEFPKPEYQLSCSPEDGVLNIP